MDRQDRVDAFVETHGLETAPEYRLLDLQSELGEIAKNAVESTEYGARPDELTVNQDELGDALFALLALVSALEIDADEALDEAIEKYERRLSDGETPASGDGKPL